jgi:ABC-2 type transport system permease protein
VIRIYQRLWQVNWAEQWQYRANLMMYMLFWLVSPVVYVAVWTTVASAQGSVSGLTAADFTSYYLALLLVDTLTSDITIHILAYKISDGTLAGDLLRPVHPILTGTLINNIAFKMLTLLALVPIWLLLCALFRPDFSSATPASLVLGLAACALGFAINFFLGAALTLVAFWTTRVYAVHQVYYAVILLFGGQFVPLDLMPPVIQSVARFLPFQLLKYFPIQLSLGRLGPDAIAQGFVAGLIWLAVAWVVFHLVWRAGVRRFSAVGA